MYSEGIFWIPKEKSADGWAHVWLASWWGNGSPRLRSVAGLRGWTATLGLRYGPDSYGRQQWGILGNGGNPDPATPREGRRLSGCKLLLPGTKDVTVPGEKATANYVPAAAVIRRWQALSGFKPLYLDVLQKLILMKTNMPYFFLLKSWLLYI